MPNLAHRLLIDNMSTSSKLMTGLQLWSWAFFHSLKHPISVPMNIHEMYLTGIMDALSRQISTESWHEYWLPNHGCQARLLTYGEGIVRDNPESSVTSLVGSDPPEMATLTVDHHALWGWLAWHLDRSLYMSQENVVLNMLNECWPISPK